MGMHGTGCKMPKEIRGREIPGESMGVCAKCQWNAEECQ